MSKDVSEIIAKLDAKVVEITAKDEKKDDMEILESIGKEKLQNYLKIMPVKVLFGILKSSGYKGSIVALRKQLAAMGAREIQPRAEGLKKGGGKPKGKQKGKTKEKHEELTQVSLLPPESKAQEKQQEKPETPPVQQAERLQEAPRTIHITGQGTETQGQQQQTDDEFAALFARKAAGTGD